MNRTTPNVTQEQQLGDTNCWQACAAMVATQRRKLRTPAAPPITQRVLLRQQQVETYQELPPWDILSLASLLAPWGSYETTKIDNDYKDLVQTHIDDNCPIILRVKNPGHFVVVWGYERQGLSFRVQVADPAVAGTQVKTLRHTTVVLLDNREVTHIVHPASPGAPPVVV